MFQKKLSPIVKRAMEREDAALTFSQIVDAVRATSGPYADIDEVLQAPLGKGGKLPAPTGTSMGQSITVSRASGPVGGKGHIPSGKRRDGKKAAPLEQGTRLSGSAATSVKAPSESKSRGTAPQAAVPLTFRNFAASLTCPKKFFLQQYHPELAPDTSIGEAVHLDDSVSFAELSRRWDRLQFGSKAIVVRERDFANAVQRTEEIVVNYFETVYAQLKEQSPSLTIHRPAFSAPLGYRSADSTSDGISRTGVLGEAESAPLLELRARPCVLRFRPKDGNWVILESAAVLDPISNATRLQSYLQRLHFSTLSFRHWITQPHIPISVRKKFLTVDPSRITDSDLRGSPIDRSTDIAVPIDIKRSGLLHIRQYFPGPVTLVDCDSTRLVKFVQRCSLEDLIVAEYTNASKAQRGASTKGGPSAAGAHSFIDVKTSFSRAKGTSDRDVNALLLSPSSSAKKNTEVIQRRFLQQQHVLEGVIEHHTMKIVQSVPQNRRLWLQLARDTKGVVHCSKEAEADANREIASGRSTTGKGSSDKPHSGQVPKASAYPPTVPEYSAFVDGHCSKSGDTCPYYEEGLCLPNRFESPVMAKDNHLFAVPSTAASRKALWWSKGMRTVRDVLHEYKRGTITLTAPQLRYVKAAAYGEVAINPKEVSKFFEKLAYPLFLIDFEATQFALPPFDRVVAYQPVPFQFSLDVFQHDILTEEPVHYDFLHFGKGYNPNADPRPGCVKELIRAVQLERQKKKKEMEASGALGRLHSVQEAERAAAAAAAASGSRRERKKGSGGGASVKTPPITSSNPPRGPVNPWDGCFVAHYAPYEKSCLEKLGQLVEEHKETIKEFYFLDTMDLVKAICHPNAHGSNSLKKVLPALCPDFQYGVFGGEGDDEDGVAANVDSSSPETRQDEQKGENAMGVFRLWMHQEGGCTIRDVEQAQRGLTNEEHRKTGVSSGASLRNKASSTGHEVADLAEVKKETREKIWATLRIQLLEYCSLDTKALYEIMREVWNVKCRVEALKTDRNGWVMATPSSRDISL